MRSTMRRWLAVAGAEVRDEPLRPGAWYHPTNAIPARLHLGVLVPWIEVVSCSIQEVTFAKTRATLYHRWIRIEFEVEG